MRLPDWTFGRRYWTGSYLGGTDGVAFYHIAEESLPDKFVVWGFYSSNNSPGMTQAMRLTVRLGSRAPVDAAEVLTLERLWKNISVANIVYEHYLPPNDAVYFPAGRQIVESGGRRLCFLANGDQANTYEMTVGILISAMPKEVPDWLVKENGY